MAFAVESIGQLLLDISIFASGMAIGIIAIILAFTRSITKNNEHWSIMFAMFAWVIALFAPSVWFSIIIFGFGAFALVLSFMPLLERMGDTNIYVLAVIAGILNFLLLFGIGAYDVSLDWNENYESSLTDIDTLLGIEITSLEQGIPDYNLCKPNELNANNETCEPDTISGSFNEDSFVPFASVITIGTYLGTGMAFFGMTALAPLIISETLAQSKYFLNPFIVYVMAFLGIMVNMAIFIKLLLFIFNKRGAR